jgi:hypothetical protein
MTGFVTQDRMGEGKAVLGLPKAIRSAAMPVCIGTHIGCCMVKTGLDSRSRPAERWGGETPTENGGKAEFSFLDGIIKLESKVEGHRKPLKFPSSTVTST